MLITIWTGQAFDTDRDLSAAERHILQKLLLWEVMAGSLEEFRQKVTRALQVGWNDSGPVRESRALGLIIQDLEKKVAARLKM
jgi:hypothetical protein